jgi:soluble epoxide hydrolase/lipid-phosphate phosphatase
MAAIAFPEHAKSLKLPSSVTYSYVHIAPTSSKPTVLFVHGFPSSSYDWRHQIAYFSSKGYGVLVPDLLGYGGTDKPAAVEDYRAKKMADEVVGILDHEKIDKVLTVSHDWGSLLQSRLANYHPDRFLGYAFLDIGYRAPGGRFNLAAVNAFTKQHVGYELSGYWTFFERPDASQVLKDHVSVCHSSS